MILGFLSFSRAFISLEFFKTDALQSENKALVDKYNFSEYCLLEGILAFYSPAIYNLRTSGPYTKRFFHSPTQNTWFTSDNTKEMNSYLDSTKSNTEEILSYVLCQMFPKVRHLQISIGLSDLDSISHTLNQFRTDNTKLKNIPEHQFTYFLTGLLFCVSNKKNNVKGRVIKTDSGITLVINKEEVLKNCNLFYVRDINNEKLDKMLYVFNLLLSVDDSKCSPLFNSKVLLKAYLGVILNKNEDLLQVYRILEKDFLPFFNLSPTTLNLESQDKELLFTMIDKIERVINNPRQFFDVSKNQNSVILSDVNKFCGLDRIYRYSYEVGLFFFFDLLLYDPPTERFINIYYTDENGQKKLSELSEILEKYSRTKNIHQALHEWSALLEGISNKSFTERYDNFLPENFFKSSFTSIFYYKNPGSETNHLSGGLINFIKITEFLFKKEKLYSSQVESILKKHQNSQIATVNQISKVVLSIFTDTLAGKEKNLKSSVFIYTDTKSFCQNFEIEYYISIKKVYEFENCIEMRLGYRGCYKTVNFRTNLNENAVIDNVKLSNSLLEMYTRMQKDRAYLVKMVYFTYFSSSSNYIFSEFSRWLSSNQEHLIYDLIWHRKLYKIDDFVNISNQMMKFCSISDKNVKLFCNSITTVLKSSNITNYDDFLGYFKSVLTTFSSSSFPDIVFNHYNLRIALKRIFAGFDHRLNFYRLWISFTKNLTVTNLKDFEDKIAFFMVRMLYEKSRIYVDSVEVLFVLHKLNVCIDIMKFKNIKLNRHSITWMPIFFLLYHQDLQNTYSLSQFFSDGNIYYLFIEKITDERVKNAMRQSFVKFVKNVIRLPIGSIEHYLTTQEIVMFQNNLHDIPIFTRFLHRLCIKYKEDTKNVILNFRDLVSASFNKFIDKINVRSDNFIQAFSKLVILNELIKCQNIIDQSVVSAKKTKIIEIADSLRSNLVGFSYKNDFNGFIDISRLYDINRFLTCLTDLLVNLIPNFNLNRAEKKKILAMSKNWLEEPLKTSSLYLYQSQNAHRAIPLKNLTSLGADFHAKRLEDILSIIKIYKNKF